MTHGMILEQSIVWYEVFKAYRCTRGSSERTREDKVGECRHEYQIMRSLALR